MQSIISPIIISLTIFITISFLLAVSWTLNIKNKDVIETAENILKIGFALFTHIIYILFICFYSISIFLHSGYKKELYIQLFIILLAVFPTAYLIITYFNLNRYFKKKFKLVDTNIQHSKNKQHHETETCVEEISENLDLTYKPKILFSNFKNISPFVFGKTSKKSFISFPSNWDEILKKASGKNKEIEKNLRRFTIFHELSHIKHKDHIFVGSSYLYLRSFKFWILGIFLLIFIYSFLIGLHRIRFFLGPIIFGIIYYFIFFLLAMSVSRNREYIADARPSVFMSKKELESISSPNMETKDLKLSYLEILFHFFSLSSKTKTNTIGISGSSTNLSKILEFTIKKIKSIELKEKISKFVHNVFYTHPRREIRLKRLNEKYFVRETHSIISKESAIWIGVISALFSFMGFFFPSETYTNYLMRPLFSTGLYQIPIIGAFLIIELQIICFIFIFPLRHSATLVTSFKRYFISLINRFFIAYAFFVIVTFMLRFIIYLTEKWYGFIKLTDFVTSHLFETLNSYRFFLAAFVCTTILVFSHFKFIYQSQNKRVSEQKSGFQFIFLLFVSIFTFMIILNLIGLTFSSLVCGFIFGGLVWFYFNMKFPKAYNILDMWLIQANTKLKKTDKAVIANLYLKTFLIISVSITILTFITSNIDSLVIYTIVLFGEAGLVFLISLLTKNVFRPSYSYVPLFLNSINKHLSLLRTFGSVKIQEKKDLIIKIITSYKLDNCSYRIHRKMNIGSTNTSYNAIYSLYFMDFKNIPQTSAAWLLSLENVDGGFSPVSGLKSRLSSTCEALSVLKRFNMLKEVNIDVHTKWIKSLQKGTGFFSDPISRYPEIEQTFYALNSLYLLGRLDIIGKRKCLGYVNKIWKVERNDWRSVYFSLKCFKLFGELNSNVKKEMINEWLYPNVLIMKKFNLDRNLSSFYYYFKIAEIVMDDINEIRNLIPGIEERVYNSFINYLEKR